MIAVAPDRRKTLDVVERISVAGRGGVGASVLLEDVCAAVADAFDFDFVAAVRHDAQEGEVREIASAGSAPADRADRERIASVSLARETQNLVLLTTGDATSAFVLPLISGDRCLAFLCGTRGARVPLTEPDGEALVTVGVIAATLLEDALVREEMQELDVLKSEFVALAAHELRNPLTSIYGISVTLNEQEHELDEPDRLALRKALRDQASRVRNLVEQLLDLARLDLAAVHIRPEPVRLPPKVEEIVRPLAAGRTKVRITVPPDLEAVVDSSALDLMLSNLVANSLRHGKPPITITAARQDRHLRLAVEDRGGGVPREFVPRLFDRFARGSESRGRGGSGLGLAIAQAYARAHGGEILYGPAVPRGARFEVVIPLRGYGDEQRRIEPRAPGAPKPTRLS